MKKDCLSVLFLSVFSTSVLAAGNTELMHIDVDLSEASLQRGARTFANYCSGCHSAVYMRYNRIGKDLNIPDEVLRTNFIFGPDKIGDTMTIAMRDTDALGYFGVVPPDLSLVARARGADWLYTYLQTFYIDESRPFGVNNLVFKDVAMPHVLWELQGMQRLDRQSGDEAHRTPGYQALKVVAPGTHTKEEYDRLVRDLVNFMVYMGEPIKLKRTKIGIWVMIYLFGFMIIAWLLKKEYWKDVVSRNAKPR